MADYKLQLILGKPIVYQTVEFIAPNIDEICDIGTELYDEIFMPFSLTEDCFKDLKSSVFHAIMRTERLAKSVCAALQLVIKCGRIDLYSNRIVCVFDKTETSPEKTFTVDADNYEDIADIMLQINTRKKYEKEPEPVCDSKRALDSWNKLKAGRARMAEKNKINLYDIINVCLYGGNYRIPLDEIKKMSLWQLMNCYKAKIDTKGYDDGLSIALVSGNSELVSDKNHWVKKLIIRE